MFEITIDNQVYQFNFGMGFLREINKAINRPVDGVPGARENVGLRYKIAQVMDGDLETLVEVLDLANKNQTPRVTREILDAYIENESTDIDKLFHDVMDFFGSANATKKETAKILEAVKAEKAKMAEKMKETVQ